MTPRGHDDQPSSDAPQPPLVGSAVVAATRAWQRAGLDAILADLAKFSAEMRPVVEQHCHAAREVPAAQVARDMQAAGGVLGWAAYPPTKIEMLAASMALLRAAEPPHTPIPAPAERYGPGSSFLPAQAPKVLCVTGYTQSGKDVVGDLLQHEYARIGRTTFSDAIMPEANEVLAARDSGLASDDRHRGERIHSANKNHFPYRYLLQAVGDARRVEDPDYWSDRMRDKIAELVANGAQAVVVTGARAVKEVRYVRALDMPDARVEVWRVKRPESPYRAVAEIELALDVLPDEDFDAVIVNDREGDLDHYHGRIREAIGQWR